MRPRLADAGFQISVDYIGEVLGNLTGGVRRGAIYEGRLGMALEVDLEKALGWTGATFRASAYQIHGQGLSVSNLGNNILTASSIEATRTTRLNELWLQQELLVGAFQLRAGQLGADDFFNSQVAASFVNNTFGWPGIFSSDLPSGGPAYPFAAPGVRLRIAPSERLTIMAAVFNGDPAGPGPGDPQLRDPSGTAFRVNDDAFAIAEIAYAVNQVREARGLPGIYKLGAWYHSGRFADQRFDAAGRSLADAASTGVPAERRGNFAIYVAIDQMLWRPAGSTDRGLSAFLRVAGSPGDRNLINFYVDGGLTYRGLVPGRDADILGMAFAYVRVSGAARGLDRDTNAFTGQSGPVRDYEAVIELTYVAQMTPWWTLQPDFQLVFHPGANALVASPSGGQVVAGNATILGLRTTVRF